MLMMMRRLSSVTLVMLLLLQTLAMNYVPEVDAATAKGGSSDDFSIFSIEVGNQTIPTENGYSQVVKLLITYYKMI